MSSMDPMAATRIALLLPDHAAAAQSFIAAEGSSPYRAMLPAYLGLLLPVCAGFFAAQVLSRSRLLDAR